MSKDCSVLLSNGQILQVSERVPNVQKFVPKGLLPIDEVWQTPKSLGFG